MADDLPAEEAPGAALLSPPPERPARVVDTPEDLRALAAQLASAPEVAIDSEANSLFAYRERTCVVQVTAGDSHAIVDTLALPDLAPLRTALDRPDLTVLFHGGDYDVSVLTRDHDLRFHRVFDTMIAATLLGAERVGLADLVAAHFGVRLDKRFQRADWGARPFDEARLDYLRRDTMYLPALAAHYRERLSAADLTEEAEIEFRRLALRRGAPVADDPEGWRRTKGADRLDARGRAVLKSLWTWREGEARSRDLPPFKVIAPQVLLRLASSPPETARSPRDLGLGAADLRRHGAALLGALRAGLDAFARGEVPEGASRERLDPDARALRREAERLEDALRTWRRQEAARRKVVPLAVLPNPGMHWLVAERPASLAELERCPDLGPKRIARYGEAWLSILGPGVADPSA
jgi:ribonuclease D